MSVSRRVCRGQGSRSDPQGMALTPWCHKNALSLGWVGRRSARPMRNILRQRAGYDARVCAAVARSLGRAKRAYLYIWDT